MTDVITIKQGASLALTLTFRAPDGTPFDISACTVTSQLRDTNGALVATLPITQPGALGVATISLSSTASIAVGLYSSDIKIVTPAGITVFSDTFTLRVARSVTA